MDDKFSEREKVHRIIAMHGIQIFDRFIAVSVPQLQDEQIDSRYTYQLAFVPSLMIALKSHPGISIDYDFVTDILCQRVYQYAELIEMKVVVLKAFSWKINVPTPHCFINCYRFLQFFPRHFVYEDIQVLTDLSEIVAEEEEELFVVTVAVANSIFHRVVFALEVIRPPDAMLMFRSILLAWMGINVFSMALLYDLLVDTSAGVMDFR